MPNPIFTPNVWGGGDHTVTQSEFVAADVYLDDLDSTPAELFLTVPVGGTVHALRNPPGWNAAGTPVLSGGAWSNVPVFLGNWTLTVTPGGAVTDPATLSINNPDGTAPTGLLRLVIRNPAVGPVVVTQGGGQLSLDRLLAAPSILNPQVASGLPVNELASVQLTSTTQATVLANPAPALPLSALPPLLNGWAPEPGNPLAVTSFMSMGTAATFTAPAAYAPANLGFRMRAAYDLDASGTVTPVDPRTEHVLNLTVQTVTHGMLLVLDRSGSMSSPLSGGGISKWDATVQAAHAWLDLFRSFRTGGSHKAGIITFEHDTCAWKAQATAADVTLRNPQNGAAAATMSALATLGDVPVLNLGVYDSCTPIGDALVKGLQVIGSDLAPGNVASLVLLTDGYENAGRVTIKNAVGPATTTFAQERGTAALSFGNGLVADRLFTVGVGTSVDADLLNVLPNPPGSGMGPGYYRLTTSATEILPTFADMLGQVLDAQRISPVVVADPDASPNALYFQVPTGEHRVAVLVPWAAATHNLRVAYRLQGSPGSFTVLNLGDPGVVGYWRRQFHGLMTVDLGVLTGSATPPATEWRVQHLDGASAPQPLTDAGVLCMVDLLTKAEIRFDKPQYFTGDAIGLQCSIRSGGLRMAGATIGVDVARPGEGLGTFLAVNADLYKKVVGDRGTGDPTGGQGGPLGGKGDPDQGKGHMFKTLLRLKGMEDLPEETPPAFHLHDDGAHGDGEKDDGDYANTFTDTVREGTYTFRFRIHGTLDDGSRYSRLFVRSTWVGVRPEPKATRFTWARVQDAWVLTFVPMSAKGEFVGPFRHDVIRVKAAVGELSGALVDNLDGSYSQRVAPGRDAPVLLIEVYGVELPATGPELKTETFTGTEPSSGGDRPGCLAHLLSSLRRALTGK